MHIYYGQAATIPKHLGLNEIIDGFPHRKSFLLEKFYREIKKWDILLVTKCTIDNPSATNHDINWEEILLLCFPSNLIYFWQFTGWTTYNTGTQRDCFCSGVYLLEFCYVSHVESESPKNFSFFSPGFSDHLHRIYMPDTRSRWIIGKKDNELFSFIDKARTTIMSWSYAAMFRFPSRTNHWI